MAVDSSAPPLRLAELSYDRFLQNYLLPNQPVILPASCTTTWSARRAWTTADATLPDWQAVSALYGHITVSVTDCAVTGDAVPTTALLSDVIDRWRKGEGRTLYVKDLHLALQGVTAFYEAPEMSALSTMDSVRFLSMSTAFAMTG